MQSCLECIRFLLRRETNLPKFAKFRYLSQIWLIFANFGTRSSAAPRKHGLAYSSQPESGTISWGLGLSIRDTHLLHGSNYKITGYPLQEISEHIVKGRKSGHYARECFLLLPWLRPNNTSTDAHNRMNSLRDQKINGLAADKKKYYKDMIDQGPQNTDARQADVDPEFAFPSEVDGRVADVTNEEYCGGAERRMDVCAQAPCGSQRHR